MLTLCSWWFDKLPLAALTLLVGGNAIWRSLHGGWLVGCFLGSAVGVMLGCRKKWKDWEWVESSIGRNGESLEVGRGRVGEWER